MKELIFMISDVNMQLESYNSILKNAQKVDNKIDQLLIDIKSQKAYCYKPVPIRDLIA